MHCHDVLSFSNAPVKMRRLSAEGLVCVCVLSFSFCPKCIVKMCRLSAMHLSRCVVFRQGVLCVCVCVCVFLFISALNALSRCRLSAMHLSRCVVFRQGVLCVCVCVLFISALNALS